jgi:luciferase family oxidoreductase group 1
MVALSVLDQSPMRTGGSAEDAIRETVQLAEAADRLGYRRYWVAEHHNSDWVASAAPEILVGQIAARTHRIRVGSGGVMLQHYSPLKVAETFHVLEALYPGRIDLGIGRATGGDLRTTHALAHYPERLGLEQFPQLAVELAGFLYDDLPSDHPYHGIRATPAVAGTPELWMLGSSEAGATLAARLGWPFSFAHFIRPKGCEDVIRTYRREFRPSSVLAEPRANLAVAVVCAESDEEAERLSWSGWGLRMSANRPGAGAVPSPEGAMSFPYSALERIYLDTIRTRSIYGDPAQVQRRLLEIGEQYDAEELMLVTITYDFAARIRSYELLAEAFSLVPG